MKRKYIVGSITAVLLLFSFLIESGNNILFELLSLLEIDSLDFYYAFKNEFWFLVILICLIAVTHQFFDFKNLLKILLCGVIFVGILILSTMLNNIIAAVLIFKIIEPVIYSLILLFAFWWITKIKLNLSRVFYIISSVIVGANILFNVLNLIIYTNFQQSLYSMENDFFSYLNLLNAYDGVFDNGIILCLYAQISLVFFVMIKSLPLHVEKPLKIEYTDEIIEPLQEIPQGMWRCMGCGEVLPLEQNRCECGYKRKD